MKPSPFARPLIALAVVTTLGGCPESSNGPATPQNPGPAEAPLANAGSTSLLRMLDEAELEGAGVPTLDLTGKGDTVLLRENFAERYSTQWFEGTWLQREDAEQRMTTCAVKDHPQESQTALSIVAGTGGLFYALSTRGSAAYQIPVKLQVAAAGPQASVTLKVSGIKMKVPRMRDRDGVAELLKQEPLLVHTEEFSVQGEGWQEVTISFPHDRRTRTLLFEFQVKAATAWVDSLEVRLDHAEESAPALQPLATTTDDSGLAARVRMGDRIFDCLALTVPSKITFDLVVPRENPRFDAAPAALGEPAGGKVQFVLALNGRTVARSSTAIARQRGSSVFKPWTVDLQEFAGRKVRLALQVRGSEGAVALLANPKVLGAAADQRPNLVLISLDTLRADHLGCYGNTEDLSPRIDEFAKQATLFTSALAPAPYTLPSHATLLSGQNPVVHGANSLQNKIAVDRTPLLASRLQQEGYFCAGFTGGGLMDPQYGFATGFEIYETKDPAKGKRSSFEGLVHCSEQLHPALSWLQRHEDQPFFLLLHTYTVHSYMPDRPFHEKFCADVPEELAKLSREVLIDRGRKGDEPSIDYLRKLYKATVLQADQNFVLPILSVLEQLSLIDNTVVAIVADHGEEFREHGAMGHGHALWGELVQVPWIMAGPGIERGLRRPDVVRLEDFTPTIARLLGLPRQDGLTGRDVLAAGPERAVDAFLHMDRPGKYGRWDALVSGNYKLMRRLNERTKESHYSLYAYPGDSYETSELSAAAEADMAPLKERLDRHLDSLRALSNPTEGVEMDAALRQKLIELGYLDPE
jgi:arylsulfatase A-like enzyme